jgi:hypothetical protein
MQHVVKATRAFCGLWQIRTPAHAGDKRGKTISIRGILAVIVATTIVGCGTPHLRPQSSAATDLPASAYIGRVTVSSQEEAAKSNVELQAKMQGWETEARWRLLQALTTKGYHVVTEAPAQVSTTLIWNLDVDVQYGNRATRYLVGFGAGKGSVHSTLVIDDGAESERYRSGVDSDLDIGVFGGDISQVMHANLDKLLSTLPAPRS